MHVGLSNMYAKLAMMLTCDFLNMHVLSVTCKKNVNIHPLCHVKINVSILAVDDGGHLRCHEELPDLRGLWASRHQERRVHRTQGRCKGQAN
jgi:hypothetical protein